MNKNVLSPYLNEQFEQVWSIVPKCCFTLVLVPVLETHNRLVSLDLRGSGCFKRRTDSVVVFKTATEIQKKKNILLSKLD